MSEIPGAQRPDTKPLPRVLMVGPALDRQGGIAAVAGSYITHWNNKRYSLAYLPTASDSSRLPQLLYFLRAAVQFCYRLIFKRPLIVHVHFGWRASFMRKAVLVILARLFPVQVVMHCHASRFDVFYEEGSDSRRRFIRWVLNKADLILVVSKAWQDYFQALTLRSPVCVLYNSVSAPVDIPSPANRQPVVVTLGRLGQRKGTYDILEMVPLVLDAQPGAQFWLAGDGDVAGIQQQLSERPWGRHVNLLGWIKDEQKDQVLRDCAIFLLPSYHEGLPIAVLEAMSYGLPVVSSPVGGIPEVVKDHETGFLVQPGDIKMMAGRVTQLLGDDSLRSELGRNARELILKEYDIKAGINRLMALYDALLIGTVSCSEIQQTRD